MNKILSCLVLLGVFTIALSSAFDYRSRFGVSKASSANCTATPCAEYKATCNATCSLLSPNTNCCVSPLYCINSTCQRSNYGSPCTNVGQCTQIDADGTLAVTCNGTCIEQYGAGDSCSLPGSPCISGLSCNNSICAGLATNATCNPLLNLLRVSQCTAPQYCSGNGMCTTPLAAGALCGPINSAIACGQNTVCSSSSNTSNANATCISIGSVTVAGTPASTPFACGSGLAFNGVACVTAGSTSLISCSVQTDCNSYGNGATCQCFPWSGNSYCVPAASNLTVNEPLYNSQLLSLANCLNDNKCSYNGYMALFGNPVYNANSAPDSCTYQNCWSEYKKYAGQYCSAAEDELGSCFYSPECGGFPIWAIVVIVIVAVILVLAVVIVIFLVLRRRKDYASI